MAPILFALGSSFNQVGRKFSVDKISFPGAVRTDLWKTILKGGFREASHISSQITISWDEASLLNLVIRRAIPQQGASRILCSRRGSSISRSKPTNRIV